MTFIVDEVESTGRYGESAFLEDLLHLTHIAAAAVALESVQSPSANDSYNLFTTES